jgi:hypothetical protein
MPLIRSSLFFLLCLSSGLVAGQHIEFYKEELAFTIDSSCFLVAGDYYFRNPSNSPLSIKIFFPVSKTKGYKAIDTIFVYDISDPSKKIPVEMADTLASFQISFSPFSEKCIKIFYIQHHNGSRARYILTTTKSWKKPLMSAKYSLIIGKDISVSHFSISPDHSEDFGESMVYYWDRKQFMPDLDFIFDFLVEKGEKK